MYGEGARAHIGNSMSFFSSPENKIKNVEVNLKKCKVRHMLS